MRQPLDPAQLRDLPDDRLARWADAYADSCNLAALEQVQAEMDRRARVGS
jgi:hypothetical protein